MRLLPAALRRATVLGAALLALPALAAAPAYATSTPDRVTVSGGAPAWIRPATPTGTPAATGRVSFSVVLSLRNAAQAERLANRVADPNSGSYGYYLSAAQFNARYAPSNAQVAAVHSFLSRQGFTITGVAQGNRWLSVTGTVAQVQAAFGSALRTYRLNGRTVTAPDRALTVPAALRGIVAGVTGLDTRTMLRHPNTRTVPGSETPDAKNPDAKTPTPQACSAYWRQHLQTMPSAYGRTTFSTYLCGYSPAQLRGAYSVQSTVNKGITGRGVTVAIVDAYASPTMVSDANAYSRHFGEPTFTAGQYTQKVFTPFDSQDACGGEEGWNGEQTLDVEAVHALAPGATIQYVGARDCGAGIDEALNDIVQNQTADLISNSYGSPGEEIDPAMHSLFVQAAAEGIGVYFSSGDDGDNTVYGLAPQPDYPASDPMVTAVGGTALAVSSTRTYQFETLWGDQVDFVDYTGSRARYIEPVPGSLFYAGGGGGTSAVFGQPDYQSGQVPDRLAVRGGAAMRVVPDVAAVADPFTGFRIGETIDGTYQLFGIGGTSLAAPVIAGIQALASQGRATRIGFANPLLYRLGTASFHDVKPPAVPVAVATPDAQALITFAHDTSIHTAAGYDAGTGLGSPYGVNFVATERSAALRP